MSSYILVAYLFCGGQLYSVKSEFLTLDGCQQGIENLHELDAVHVFKASCKEIK